MKNFKRLKSGFTLVEVLVTLTIVALLVTPLMIWLSTLMNQVTTQAHAYARIVAAHEFLFAHQAGADEDLPKEKKIPRLRSTLTYTSKTPSNSSAVQSYKGVTQEQVAISWKRGNKTYTDNLITFAYVPQEQKNE